jgi:MFS family permease
MAVRHLLHRLVLRGGGHRPAGTLSALILMRLLIGMAEGMTYRYLANNFAESQKGTALGIFSIGGKMGPALGAPIAAWIIVHYSWQAMFICTGLAGLVWLWPWLRKVRNDFPSQAELAGACSVRRRCRCVIC